ncbi:MAG: hypothetical protein ABII71_04795 [Candidatus Micrarchaeota archaeon]
MKFWKLSLIGIVFLVLATSSFAETTCTRNGCDIEITLKIAFQGATPQYINNVETEIEGVWNGPNGFQTVGDCKCKMTFNVITSTAADCKNNPPAGWHCVMVTDYNNDPPRNQTNWNGAKFYIGYMYGVSSGNGGNSQMGWWSNIMSRPVDPNNPGGEHYKDFAHEAGHMMGLEDGDGGIMSQTSGPNSNPTQANLDEIANDVCGNNYCPDSCCCGNSEIDRTKGETCDPMAMPDGCAQGQSCCAVCCNCYGPLCIAANGEYTSEQACQSSCGGSAKCYKNYKSGCWDCVRQNIVVHGTCRDPTNIRGNSNCDHVQRTVVEIVADFYDTSLSSAPIMGDVFRNERINIDVEGRGIGHIVTSEGAIIESGDGPVDGGTVTITTDSDTVEYLAADEMTVQQGVSSGRIRIDGLGIVDGMKFGVYHLIFDIYNLVSPGPEFIPPEYGDELPLEYQEQMLEIIYAEPASGDDGVYDPEHVPDGGYIGSNVFPE